jgi:hypothetical protein
LAKGLVLAKVSGLVLVSASEQESATAWVPVLARALEPARDSVPARRKAPD